MNDYFTVNELAREFRVDPKTIYRLAERGEIPGHLAEGDWRFPKSQTLEAFYRETNPQVKEEANARSRRTIQKMKLLELRERFHKSVVRSLKRNLKGCKWERVVGYGLETLKRKLKKTIPEGYAWRDFLQGRLQLDHIIPGSLFNIGDLDCLDLRRCWELKNLRLLPENENKEKGAKLLHPFQPGLKLKGACV